jgi:TolB-like protein/class 3 adenylate cyclase/Tfp pilus assembly protein PilF
MSDIDLNRRLTTIVAADVAEYSRLVRKDEEGTLLALRGHRQELFNPLIEQYGGRIANTAGDSLLIEFPSAVEAVRCAMAVQAGLVERNKDVAADKQLTFRIGINIGDVVSEGIDLLGDGVNVAARIEGLADPGGICLSRSARDQVRDQLDLNLQDMGDVEVKNIARPIRVFKVLADGAVAPVPNTSISKSMRLLPAFFTTLLMVAIVGGGGWWWQQQRYFEPANPAKFADKLPDKPSIAVLPFANLSDDKDQEYFADGMTDDLITDLSKVSGLIVIARNSVFTYKGKNVKVQEIAKDLNVTHVLEGSVRRSGKKIRINSQLINATTGNHLWAERYDGTLEDVFSLQDRLTAKIVEAMVSKLLAVGNKGRNRKVNPRAYEHFLKGHAALVQMRYHNALVHARIARENLEKSLALDPTDARTLANLGWFYFLTTEKFSGLTNYGSASRARELANKSYQLEKNASAMMLQAAVMFDVDKRDQEALALGASAVAMTPSDLLLNEYFGSMLLRTGQIDKATTYLANARRLDPLGTDSIAVGLGLAHLLGGDAVAAEEVFRAQIEVEGSMTTFLSRVYLAAALQAQGKSAEAAAQVNIYLESCSFCTLLAIRNTLLITYGFRSDLSLTPLFEALRQTAIPAEPQ